MEFAKRVIRKDTEGNFLRYDYYLTKKTKEQGEIKTQSTRITEEEYLRIKEAQKRTGVLTMEQILDQRILRKLISVFLEEGLTISFEDDEFIRVEKLIEEVQA